MIGCDGGDDMHSCDGGDDMHSCDGDDDMHSCDESNLIHAMTDLFLRVVDQGYPPPPWRSRF